MKRNKTIVIVCILFSYCCSISAQEIDLAPLYQQLRNAIDSIEIYDAIQQKKIDDLKNELASSRISIYKEEEICKRLFESYSKFCYDSANVYLNRCIEISRKCENGEKQMEYTLLQARYYGSAGSYVEALHLINNIKEEEVSQALHPLYLDAIRSIYLESGNVLHNQELREEYLNRSNEYRKQLFESEDSLSLPILKLREGKARYNRDFDEAERLSDLQLRMIEPDTPYFSEVAFFRSCTFRDMGDKQMHRYWLLRSALSDIRNSIKDQASLWSLAALVAEDGDTELSYLLIRTSHEGLSFYNAPLRYLQSVNILSMIDHNYQKMTNQQNTQLRWLLWIISILALLLLTAFGYIYRQMKRLNTARIQLHNANEDLKSLNKQLNYTVESLNTTNHMLSESNTIKDEYIGKFISLCSEYMKKMDSFRSTVLKKEKSGQLQEYLSTSRMREIKAKEIAAFTSDFDRAFLHIVPTFIDEFNALLKPEGQIILQEQFTLTTELRIFALIRLGISDSSKIAEFLHYSVQTIYNYRSTVKNNAVDNRSDFEDKVRKIGNS